MAPHPPFFINADCEVVYEVARTGVAFQEAGVSEDLRQTYLEDQMACVEDFMIELVNAVGEKSIVVVVSDMAPIEGINWYGPQTHGPRMT